LERGKDLLTILHQKVLEAEEQMNLESQKLNILVPKPLPALTYQGGPGKVSSASIMEYAQAKRA
jgi:hypothetical protein